MDFLTIVNSNLSAVLTFEPTDIELVGQVKVIELESYDPVTLKIYQTDMVEVIIRE